MSRFRKHPSYVFSTSRKTGLSATDDSRCSRASGRIRPSGGRASRRRGQPPLQRPRTHHERRSRRYRYRHWAEWDGKNLHFEIRHRASSRRVLDVGATYVNCWRNYTRFRALYQILDDIGATIDIHRQSTPHDELIDRLQQHDGPRTVVILDEADQLEDPSVIYDLHSFPQFAIICIANKEEELFSRVDDRLVSRLRSSEHVRMDKYHDEQLYGILSARAKWGLEEDVVDDDQLYRIADAAVGDARLAIGILRTAANKASRENQGRITDDILIDAAEDARAQIRQKTLDSLTPHQRTVYDIVRDYGPLGPSEIHDRYSEEVDDPRTERTVRSYLSKMSQYNLLEAKGTSRDREYSLSIRPPRRRCSNADGAFRNDRLFGLRGPPRCAETPSRHHERRLQTIQHHQTVPPGGNRPRPCRSADRAGGTAVERSLQCPDGRSHR
jgi:Cdc6-like AAA superfamily ATPase